MANGEELLRKLAKSEEIDIETRHDPKSPLHRTTIWIVPTGKGVYFRSGSSTGRWPDSAKAVVRRSRLNTTLRLIAT